MVSLSPVILWLIIGLVFIVAEMFLPGFIIGFFGIGALLTCLTALLGITPTFGIQVLVFAIGSLFMLIVFHLVVKKNMKGKIQGEIANINIQIGKIVPVTEFIDPDMGGGKVKYQGTLWNATSEEKIPPGDSARVIGCDNLTLKVEPVYYKGELS